ncbi:hypothetical protein OG430_08280 [Streptomyces sp. NBC_01304]|nr:hypothetical protein OG430_08280 [Streptomyces sp. NBC_01304]
MGLLETRPGEHPLQTAALLRRSHPSDKELQVAGLVKDLPAEAVRGLLGERVAWLIDCLRAGGTSADAPGPPAAPAEDAASLRQAVETARVAGVAAGVLEDWRDVLELVAAHRSSPAHRSPSAHRAPSARWSTSARWGPSTAP